MPRMLHDRYVAYDEVHGCDLSTGDDVRFDNLPVDSAGEPLPALVEVLREGREGDPRWVVADVRSPAQAAAVASRAAADGRVHGYVPILVPMYLRLRDALASDLDERTLLLIGSLASDVAPARGDRRARMCC